MYTTKLLSSGVAARRQKRQTALASLWPIFRSVVSLRKMCINGIHVLTAIRFCKSFFSNIYHSTTFSNIQEDVSPEKCFHYAYLLTLQTTVQREEGPHIFRPLEAKYPQLQEAGTTTNQT